MKSSTTDAFWKCYETLPAWIQRQAKVVYRRFLENPQHPGLQFKQILKQSSTYSIRVTENYWALGVLDGGEIIWLWIGSHADYD